MLLFLDNLRPPRKPHPLGAAARSFDNSSLLRLDAYLRKHPHFICFVSRRTIRHHKAIEKYGHRALLLPLLRELPSTVSGKNPSCAYRLRELQAELKAGKSMRVLELMRKAGTVARTQGLPETMRRTRNWLSEKYHERRFGIETEGYVTLRDLGVDSIVDYDPTDYGSLFAALNRLDISPERDVFLDFGCGKGRVLVIAATYPFRRVLGIDFVPQLVAAAKENVRRAAKKLRCREVVILTEDIAAFRVPDDINVTFVNVSGILLPTVIRNLRESLDRTPRKLTILFKQQIWVEDLFATCGWVRAVAEIPCYAPNRERFFVYESRPRSFEA